MGSLAGGREPRGLEDGGLREVAVDGDGAAEGDERDLDAVPGHGVARQGGAEGGEAGR